MKLNYHEGKIFEEKTLSNAAFQDKSILKKIQVFFSQISILLLLY
jgi:hypothetical protein